MIYILTFIAGFVVGYSVEAVRDMITDEYDEQ